MVGRRAYLNHSRPQGMELLADENVGNLVCPTAFDLGAQP